MEENESQQLNSSPSRKLDNVDDQGFIRLEPEPQDDTYVSATESEMVADQEDYSDEKKDEMDSEEQTKSMNASANTQTHNDIEPIETSSGYEEKPSAHGFSPAGRQSPAMRGAHEILKRRRAEA